MNEEGKIALSHFADSSIWENVVEVIGPQIAKAALAMGPEFTEWLEKRWRKDEVYQLLCQSTQEHVTALSNPRVKAPMWTKLSTWAPKKGLLFQVENTDLNEALKTWHTTLGEENEEEAAELVRTLIKKKGVLVKLLGNDNDLESAVDQWNERDKQLSE